MLAFTALEALAEDHGLHAVATIPVPEALTADGLDALLADGVGDMHYLREHRELRLHPDGILPGARSLVVTLLPYQAELQTVGALGLKRARYAAGKDYHGLLRKRLARLGRAISVEHGGESRATVDSAPVNERQLARMAGLGWIGRNALLLRRAQGSYHFIGCLFTTVAIETRRDREDHDHCGSCTACETRCPTRALVDRRVRSEHCISYLTIEHHGVIPRRFAERFEGWWFGCDLCQEVCPWNRFAPPAADARLTGSEDERALLAVTAADFDHHFAGRAVRRIGYERFRRNLLVALWSLGQHGRAREILAEGLPLVRAQARELGLAGPGT